MDIDVPSGRAIGGRCINEFKTSKSRFCCPAVGKNTLFDSGSLLSWQQVDICVHRFGDLLHIEAFLYIIQNLIIG